MQLLLIDTFRDCVCYDAVRFHTFPFPDIPSNISLCEFVPDSTFAVPRDCNSLFSSLSYSVTGSPMYAVHMRCLVCEAILTTPFVPEQFAMYSASKASDAYSYLISEDMTSSDVYPGDIEISTFATFFKVNVDVYIAKYRCWFRFHPIGVSNSVPSIFLLYLNKHFEAVLKVVQQTAPPVIPEGIVRISHLIATNNSMRALPVVSPPTLETILSCDRNFHDFTPTFSTTSHVTCDSCSRSPTVHYPFNVTLITSGIRNRKYGKKLNSSANLCQLCVAYVTKSDFSWSTAWPSVIYAFLNRSQSPLLFLLPTSIINMWAHCLPALQHIVDEPVFRDRTFALQDFTSLIGSRTSHGYIAAMNSYCTPDIRCFCGASEFLERTGRVDFAHFLNYLDSAYISGSASWLKNLRCMRDDYTSKLDSTLPFAFRPAVVVSASAGLQILTCRIHDGGSNLQLIHVARNPTCGNLCHASENRLAPLVPSLREATPLKVGSYSHTFTMTRLIGGHKGVSSLVLHKQRCFNVKSDFLLPSKEYLIVHHRLDARELLSSIQQEDHLDDEFLESLYQPTWLKSPVINLAVASATFVPMCTLLKIKDQLDATESSINQKPKIICNNLTKSGVQPVLPSSQKVSDDYVHSFVSFIFNNLPYLFNELSNVSNDVKSLLTKAVVCDEWLLPQAAEAWRMLTRTSSAAQLSFTDTLALIFSSIDAAYVIDSSRSLQEIDAALKNPATRIVIWLGNRRSTFIYNDVLTACGFDNVVSECPPLRNAWTIKFAHQTQLINPWFIDIRLRLFSQHQNLAASVRCHIFVRHQRSPPSVLNYFSGQNTVCCPLHSLLLSCDFPKTKYVCNVHNCKKKSKWRCPLSECHFCLCNEHLSLDVTAVINCPEPQLAEPQIEESSDDDGGENDCASVTSGTSFQLLPPIPQPELLSCHFNSDAALPAHPVTREQANSDLEVIPVHALFNRVVATMDRPKNPVTVDKKFQRYLQNFATQYPLSSIGLLQLEALLFPSIFYYQLPDGVYAGAIPFFLYTSAESCKKYGFHDLWTHFVTRITDFTLPTSGSLPYMQHAADCLINLNLSHHHSRAFFKKGIHSLNVSGARNRKFHKEMTLVTTDTSMNVQELSTAVASDTVSLFLTLTLNQKYHPGVGPIWDQIEARYKDISPEVYRAAVEGFMTTLVRCWSRSVNFLLDLLLHNNENIVGDVKKMWARAEFQSTTANLPHYHVLLWLHEKSLDTDRLIQCAHKNIRHALNNILNSNLALISDEDHLNELFELCIQLHTHNCERSNYRCMKRVDAEGNKVCRTPPLPDSHCHWLLDIDQQYPAYALDILEQLGLAEKDPRFDDCRRATGKLKSHKHMYAAVRMEHMVPTTTHLFCITKSSTNLLATDLRFASSYLVYYMTKKEEHASAHITNSADGKCFRIRDDGIQNRSLASVRLFEQRDRQKERKREKLDSCLISSPEVAYWLLQEPVIITNMTFIHIANVSPELRYTVARNGSPQLARIVSLRRSFPSNFSHLQPTRSQNITADDAIENGEVPDKITLFSLRCPLLLPVDNLKVFFQCIHTDTKSISRNDLVTIFQRDISTIPFIDCFGRIQKVRLNALDMLYDYVISRQPSIIQSQLLCILSACKDNPQASERWLHKDESNILPEIVFKVSIPRYVVSFLVSFLLRYGHFQTELDLFSTNDLLVCYQSAGLIPHKTQYTLSDVNTLLNTFVHDDLLYSAGGAMSFSAKLVGARSSFAKLLQVTDVEHFNSPLVLISDIHEEQASEIELFESKMRSSVFNYVSTLNLLNAPRNVQDCTPTNENWSFTYVSAPYQSRESSEEQQLVTRKLIHSIDLFLSRHTHNSLKRNNILLGPPGSGKSTVTAFALAYGVFNGLLCMPTSLHGRRSQQLGGEHIHRLFKIPSKSLPARELADTALIRLSSDLSRKCFLEKLQVLVIEEISVINAELFAAVDLILQDLHDNVDPFGGIVVIANGDCLQLPTISGCDIFLSSTLLFGFEFHFLRHLVRMQDASGKELIKLMSVRPVPDSNTSQIIDIVKSNCNFVSTWDDIDPSVMRVFGKKSAERSTIAHHFARVRNSGVSYSLHAAVDEMSLPNSHVWRAADSATSSYLTSQVREPPELLLYESAIVRVTANMRDICQGSLCVVNFLQSNSTSIHLFKAPSPEAMTPDALHDRLYLQWPTTSVSRTTGFTQSFRGNSCRRRQFPLSNYVASNCHRLLGDTFPRLATAVSSNQSEFSLWLPSQVFVILSRVRHLNQLYFVGDQMSTLNALKSVLKIRNLHEELIYTFFNRLQSSYTHGSSVEVPYTPFLRSNFKAPVSAHGYVYCLVSMKSTVTNNFIIRQTTSSLSKELRSLNSTESEFSNMYSGQSWVPGFVIWKFVSDDHREQLFLEIQDICQREAASLSFRNFASHIRSILQQYNQSVMFCLCGRFNSSL